MSAVVPPKTASPSPLPALNGVARGSARGALPPGAGHTAPATESAAWLKRWWPLCLGLAALLASTSVRFAQSIWQQPEFEHGPLLLAATAWVLWQNRADIRTAPAPSSAAGAWLLFVLGIAGYLLGVRLKAHYIEFGSFIPVLAASLGLVGGWSLVRRCTWAFVFLCLAVPMPAPLIFAATSDLKEWVSRAAEFILHLAGYPVARDGVTLRMGQYNLLLADACSGMNSLISLSAVGLLYVYLTARRGFLHLAILLASIVPVAIATNIVRVLILMLITYHLGDEAGQGFLHEFAGFVMFLVALGIMASIDVVLGKLLRQAGPVKDLHAIA